jgi:hypothetical protein
MQPLAKVLRNDLEKTVKSARDIAENAAKACLEQLGVGETAPFSHLSDDQKDLRRRLRVHGRQLGDYRSAKGEQEITRLMEEVAYEHWHRMLFARFLAENNLLMFDGVAVTLEECAELAEGEGFTNEWELAASLAAAMLPQIFRTDSVVFKLKLSPEHQRSLERLIGELSVDVFTASDSLGWVYQFWQSKRKEEVNASEVKIGARELPAVTQLFTEPYMVAFLLDNSLGAWWAAQRLSKEDFRTAKNEEELREKAAIPGVPLEYLRFVRQDDGSWTPTAGTFDGWPKQLAELKTLDPCCGSGHFLVAALMMLVPMRMVRDGLSAKEAVDATLRDNIHGLELDQRCVELAAFALALTAWKVPHAGGYRVLPELNVACSGLSISTKKEEWLALAGDNTNQRIALDELYKQFKDAQVLGSLINPEASLGKGSLFGLKWKEAEPLLTKALLTEEKYEQNEISVIARGIAKSAELLSRSYHLIITNVPYRKKADLCPFLQEYITKKFSLGKAALETAFLERLIAFTQNSGTICVVIMQNFLSLKSYSELRYELLNKYCWNFTSFLGHGAFDTISGEVVKVALLNITKDKNIKDVFAGIDVSEKNGSSNKSIALIDGHVSTTKQSRQTGNPDHRITLDEINQQSLLSEYLDSLQGLSTGDNYRMIFKYWEADSLLSGFEYEQGSVGKLSHYKGREHIVDINSIKSFGDNLGSALRGQKAWGRPGVAVDRMGNLSPCFFTGNYFDINIAVLLPYDNENILPIMVFCESGDFTKLVRVLDKKAGVTNATLGKVHFNLDHWSEVAKEKYPNGMPKPYTDDPTQWIFHGHPCGSVIWNVEKKWTTHGPLRTDDTVLHVAIARLLGYRWPAELDTGMELGDEQRGWVKRCAALASYADEDGIVCIPPVRGEASASDRLLNLLAAAYGDAWSNDTLAALLKSADHAGKTLETWLREKFFTQHCKLFQHRPFIWHIWDGLRDGFAALVNYHKLDYKNLETLTYTYLGDWITRQKQDLSNNVDGAAEKLAAAEALKRSLELILKGEKPYDIFVRWKAIDKQPIGWNPDLNDGVRLNIRPFMTAPDVAKKGAGILRDKPNIKWDKDRGKDVESAPWYPVFKGDRINDHHLNLAEKRAARQQPIDNL